MPAASIFIWAVILDKRVIREPSVAGWTESTRMCAWCPRPNVSGDAELPATPCSATRAQVFMHPVSKMILARYRYVYELGSQL